MGLYFYIKYSLPVFTVHKILGWMSVLLHAKEYATAHAASSSISIVIYSRYGIKSNTQGASGADNFLSFFWVRKSVLLCRIDKEHRVLCREDEKIWIIQFWKSLD